MSADDLAWRAAALAKATHGAELFRRYGAHGLGVGWVNTPDGPHPGLLVQVSGGETILDRVRVDVDGVGVDVPVLIEVGPQASPEPA